jgi:hypothetical protein
VDIARSEQVESELDAMIRRRDTHRRQTEGERLEEELYEPSVRAWRELQEIQKRTARFEYHRDQAERLRHTLEDLIARHEAAAERYLQDEPKGAA